MSSDFLMVRAKRFNDTMVVCGFSGRGIDLAEIIQSVAHLFGATVVETVTCCDPSALRLLLAAREPEFYASVFPFRHIEAADMFTALADQCSSIFSLADSNSSESSFAP